MIDDWRSRYWDNPHYLYQPWKTEPWKPYTPWREPYVPKEPNVIPKKWPHTLPDFCKMMPEPKQWPEPIIKHQNDFTRITLCVAGIPRDKLEVYVENSRLIVTTKAVTPWPFNGFSHNLGANVNVDDITTTFKDGVLFIDIPKCEAVRKDITIH